MKEEEIRHLAQLARLELTDEEVINYQKEIGDILGYVEQIKEIADEELGLIESAGRRNVFREDDDSIESGIFKDDLLAEAPETKDDYIKVQKILNTDNAGH